MRSCLSISYNDFETSTYIVSLGRGVSYFAYTGWAKNRYRVYYILYTYFWPTLYNRNRRVIGKPRTSNFTTLVKFNYENNQQDALCRLIYYSKSNLHVLGDVFARHQEHLTVFTVSGSVHPSCCRLAAGSNLDEHYQML
jgi:hypothetical protein